MKFKKFGDNNDQGKYLKIAPNSHQVMVLRGEIVEFGTMGEGKDFKKVPVNTPGSRIKFMVNAIVHENDTFVAKVFEFGLMIYKQLAQLNEEMNLEETKIKIMRTGQGKSTDYSVIPLIREPLSPKQLEQIKAVELHFLDAPGKMSPQARRIINYAEQPHDFNAPMPDLEDSVPF